MAYNNYLNDAEDYLRLCLLAEPNEIHNISCPPPTGDVSAGSVLIEQTGGERATFVSDYHTFQIEVWHDTTDEAFELANQVANKLTSTYSDYWIGLPRLISLPHFSTTSRSGGRIKSTNPEKASRMFCYLFNIELHLRRV